MIPMTIQGASQQPRRATKDDPAGRHGRYPWTDSVNLVMPPFAVYGAFGRWAVRRTVSSFGSYTPICPLRRLRFCDPAEASSLGPQSDAPHCAWCQSMAPTATPIYARDVSSAVFFIDGLIIDRAFVQSAAAAMLSDSNSRA